VRRIVDRPGRAPRSGVAAIAAAVLLAGLAASPATELTVVPSGNRNLEQPEVPGGSARRTEALRTSYEEKYRRVLALLSSDEKLRRKIVETAERYQIDPMHIVGAIVGEHTYNVDAYDRLQAYYVKAISYVNSSFTFSFAGEAVGQFVERPQFSACFEITGSYELWACREAVWDEHFRGQTVDGRTFPDDRFSAVFFQPFYAGQTFGLGQLNPLTALQMTDMVARISGQPKLNHLFPQEVYRTIMDPDLTLPYIAATIRKAIEAYRDIAGFDITGNPGITATLYNLGNPERRAEAIRRENDRRRAAGEPARLPEENYYGWLVNDRLSELKPLFPAR
jgi:hypothetical protein